MIALLLALSPGLAGETIDLDTALALALRDGVDAQEAALAERAAEAALASRRLAGLPDLRLGASAALGVDADGAAAQGRLGLSSSTTLYTGGTLAAERQAAEAALRAASAAREVVEADLRLALADALLTLAERETARATARENLAAETALVDRVAALVAAGARTRADALQQAASAARARATLAAAERDAQVGDADLRQLLRLPPAGDVLFVAPVTGPAQPDDPAALSARAFDTRPELRVLRAAEAAAAAERRAAAGGALPSVGLAVAAAEGLGHDLGAAEVAGPSPSASATLSVDVPLFDRRVTRSAVEAADAAERAARLARAAGEEAVTFDVVRALARLRAAEAEAAAAADRREAAAAAAAVLGERYAAGAATFAELQFARAEAQAARSAAEAAGFALVRQQFVLARAVGAP
jgi:outer membrane protein